MKHWQLLASTLVICLGSLPSRAQDRTEFVITNRHGQSRLWMLPNDWRPTIENGTLELSGGSTIHASDLLAIRPKRVSDTPGYHAVPLILTFTNGRSAEQTFWVPDDHTRMEDCPLVGEFRLVDERTWIRVDAYRVK